MGLFSRKTYIIHSPQNYETALAYEKGLGERCYIPGRDTMVTSQKSIFFENERAKKNRRAMAFAKKTVVIVFDETPEVFFWWGVAFAMNKNYELVVHPPKDSNRKLDA